jgi:hypothetical protein
MSDFKATKNVLLMEKAIRVTPDCAVVGWYKAFEFIDREDKVNGLETLATWDFFWGIHVLHLGPFIWPLAMLLHYLINASQSIIKLLCCRTRPILDHNPITDQSGIDCN